MDGVLSGFSFALTEKLKNSSKNKSTVNKSNFFLVACLEKSGVSRRELKTLSRANLHRTEKLTCEDYGPESFNTIIALLDRHSKIKGYSHYFCAGKKV